MKTLKQRLRYKITYKMLFEQFKKYDKLVLLTHVDQKEGNYTDNTVVIGNMIEKYPETYSNTSPKKVISVGSMDDDRKGFIKQIMIWKKIAPSFPDWTLNIYGGGARSTYYKELIEKENLTGKVILHGKSSEIPKRMEESSIFIMTSEAEGLPMVLIEAMSSGIPCVSYDCPTGPSDIINDGVDGFVIDLNNEEEFINKLKLLMQEDSTRKEFGKQARENGKRYLPNVIMPKWEKLFEELTK